MTRKIKVCKKIENDEIVWAEYFTSDGKIEKKEDYKDGKLRSLETFTYEKQYTLCKVFNAEGVLVVNKETWYNENNQIEKEESGFGIEKYHYDDNQRLLSMKEFDLENNLKMTLEYSYVENEEYMKYFDSLGILQSLVVTIYNDTKKPSRITYLKRPELAKINTNESDGFEEFFEMMKAFNFDINGHEKKTSLSMEFLKEDHLYEYDQFGNELFMKCMNTILNRQ